MATRNVLALPSRVPVGAPANGDGIALGSGPVTVDVYIDFLCPFCRMFEEQNGEAVDELADRGMITLVYHPLGFLDRLSTTQYSTRAAAASGCASDGGHFREYLYTLYDNQPPEGTAGLSDEELVQLGLQAGLDENFGRVRPGGGRHRVGGVRDGAGGCAGREWDPERVCRRGWRARERSGDHGGRAGRVALSPGGSRR